MYQREEDQVEEDMADTGVKGVVRFFIGKKRKKDNKKLFES